MSKKIDLLPLYPKRTVDFSINDKGVAVLQFPRFRGRILGRILQPLLKGKPYIFLHLDDIGTHAWQMMDGAKSVEMIIDEMTEHFGERVEPAVQRVSAFVVMLQRSKAVDLLSNPIPSQDSNP